MLHKFEEHINNRGKGSPTEHNNGPVMDRGMSPFEFCVVSLGATAIVAAFLRVIFHI